MEYPGLIGICKKLLYVSMSLFPFVILEEDIFKSKEGGKLVICTPSDIIYLENSAVEQVASLKYNFFK